MKGTLDIAVESMRNGGVIACPTESVWGLSCDPNNEAAVGALLLLKKRPIEKGLILVAARQTQFDNLLNDLSKSKLATLKESWPGPNTWLVPHQDKVPTWITGSHDKVALRVTNHPIMHSLCLLWGGPLVSSSANPAGLKPAKTSQEVKMYFPDEPLALVYGETGDQALPSKIRDLDTGSIIRP